MEPGFGGLPFHICFISLNLSLSLSLLIFQLIFAINMILLGFEAVMSESRGVHGTGGSGICKYPDPFQMFRILKFKIRSQIHKKKSPFRFVPIFRDKTVRFSVLVEISNRTRRNGYSDKNIKTLKKKLFMKSLATISITRL